MWLVASELSRTEELWRWMIALRFVGPDAKLFTRASTAGTAGVWASSFVVPRGLGYTSRPRLSGQEAYGEALWTAGQGFKPAPARFLNIRFRPFKFVDEVSCSKQIWCSSSAAQRTVQFPPLAR